MQPYTKCNPNATECNPYQKLRMLPKNSRSFEREFFYPSRQAWHIITRQRVYHQHGNAVLYLITPLGVHKILSA